MKIETGERVKWLVGTQKISCMSTRKDERMANTPLFKRDICAKSAHVKAFVGARKCSCIASYRRD